MVRRSSAAITDHHRTRPSGQSPHERKIDQDVAVMVIIAGIAVLTLIYYLSSA